jgi:uncharacterized protein DUF1963
MYSQEPIDAVSSFEDRSRLTCTMARDLTDRRGFFQSLLGGIDRGASPLLAPFPGLRWPSPAEPPAPRSLHPVIRQATLTDLRSLVDEHGLGPRAAEVERLTRSSVRLLPTDGPHAGRSACGGDPHLPPDVAWPTWRGRELDFLLELALDEVTAAGFRGDLPERGSMFVFYDSARRTSGLEAGHNGSVAVVTSEDELLAAPARRRDDGADTRERCRLEFSVELVLPRVWAAAVAALDLNEDEIAAWQRVRSGLAALQGVPPHEEAVGVALHRLGGYPEETRGGMPLIAELASQGFDVLDPAPELHVAARAHREGAEHWGMLLQLSSEERLGWSWGTSAESRLYVWTRDVGTSGAGQSVWALVR